MTDQIAEFIPTFYPVRKLWGALNSTQKTARLAAALSREEVVKGVQAAIVRGDSERQAIEGSGRGTDRSTFRRWRRGYAANGLDGLIDLRYPPRREPVTESVASAICALREADPDIGVAAIKEHILAHRRSSVSAASIKRILKRAGLSRPRGRARPGGSAGTQRFEMGGMVALVKCAIQETGCVEAMGAAVSSCLEQIKRPAEPLSEDKSDRDEFGRFLPSYNQRFCRQNDSAIGPGFESVELKRAKMDPERLHVRHARERTIEQKLTGLLMSPALEHVRLDDLRATRGQLLEEFCGFPYMPSTLDLFTRELKYVGVASTLWEVHARLWRAQTADWESPRSRAVLYIDEVVKPVHTKLFSESSRVSCLGRVMPSLEVVSFHTGSGVPIWMVTCSGRTPLVKAVPELLERIPSITGDQEIGRITVIDAEGNSVPYVKTIECASPSHAWVMAIKTSMVDGKYIFNRCNYRPYRKGERIRMGLVDLNDSEVKGGLFRVRIIELERANKRITYLAASTRLSDRDWTAADIADLYFDRWPAQEANFRSVNQATAFKDVHGYGKQLVDNMTVVTKQDELRQQIKRLSERHEATQTKLETTRTALKQDEELLRRLQRRQTTVERNLDGINIGDTISKKQTDLLNEQRELHKRTDTLSSKIAKTQSRVDGLDEQAQRTQSKIDTKTEESQRLEGRKKILRHDTELDSLFTLLKVTLATLISYVLRNYLGGARMEPETFLKRIGALPATRRLTPQLEIFTFDYNARDPETMKLLEASRDAINQRMVQMPSGRVLRIAVAPAPPPARPPPAHRGKTQDRLPVI